MSSILASRPSERPRVIPENVRRTAKAALRKPENASFWRDIGAAMRRTMELVGWNLEQLAAALNRDPRQVRRWFDGEERPQVDTLWAVPALRNPFVIALAELVGQRDGIEVETVVRVRRIA